MTTQTLVEKLAMNAATADHYNQLQYHNLHGGGGGGGNHTATSDTGSSGSKNSKGGGSGGSGSNGGRHFFPKVGIPIWVPKYRMIHQVMLHTYD